jgi:ADP-ribosylglycohydrolase
MLGAIAGDIIGSPDEHSPVRSTNFPLFGPMSRWTDDTVMTVAVASAILEGVRYAEAMRCELADRFGYDLDRTVAGIRPAYRFDISCQGIVPEAIIAFLDSDDYEHAVRLAVSLGGDSDTLACITGSIAEACYGVPEAIAGAARWRLPDDLLAVVDAFEARYAPA